jgi:hypothetical protein
MVLLSHIYPQPARLNRFCALMGFNLPRMKRFLVIALLLTTISPSAHAQDCIERACIDVYTQDGKIVIEGRKGTGAPQKKVVAPAPSKTRKPVVKKTITPQPKPTGIAKPKIITATKKPIVKKRIKPEVAPTATSLSDKLIEILPTAGIAYSPSFQPLIKVPVFFWSDIPTIVTKKIEIVGEVVEVSLKPTFIWHYGDGIFFITRSAGAPFPDGQIQHSYSNPGHYLIQLITSWDGEFTVQGVKSRIPGKIESVSVLPISVVAAPTRFSSPVTLTR